MADTKGKNANAAEKADKSESSKGSDAIFMVECLKHVQNPVSIDVNAVAKALDYKNSASVANRIRALKKKFDLPHVACCSGPSAEKLVAGAPVRKGAKAARGPIKATAEDAGDASETSKTTEKKPASRRGRKPKKEAEVKDEAAEAKKEEDDEDMA